MHTHTCTYIHLFIHTYTHAHIHPCIHTYTYIITVGPALTVYTYITDKSVEEVDVEDDSMNAAEWDVEEKPREGGVVTVTYTVVDPGTVVVHLHNTSVERGKGREGKEGEEGERGKGEGKKRGKTE